MLHKGREATPRGTAHRGAGVSTCDEPDSTFPETPVNRRGDACRCRFDGGDLHRVGTGGAGGDGFALADVTADLSTAMRINPHLRVLSLNGYYDMATPFFGAEYDLNHMMLDPERRPNLTFKYYESGHMIYIHPESMQALRRDLVEFYNSAAR